MINKKKEITELLKDNLNIDFLQLEDLSQNILEEFLNKKHYLSDDIRFYIEKYFEEDIWTDFTELSKNILLVLKK